MPNRLSSLRQIAYLSQRMRCYYCGSLMWESNPAHFMTKYGLSRAQAEQLRCTAEHLQPRSEGGANSKSNIVAACRFCNHTRHKALKPLDPIKYKLRVDRRVSKGSWFPGRLIGQLA